MKEQQIVPLSYHIIIGVQGHLGSYQIVADGGHTTKKISSKAVKPMDRNTGRNCARSITASRIAKLQLPLQFINMFISLNNSIYYRMSIYNVYIYIRFHFVISRGTRQKPFILITGMVRTT